MARKIRVPAISTINGVWVSCEVVMYVIVAASVDANRILVDEERMILAANLIFLLNSSGLIILHPSIRTASRMLSLFGLNAKPRTPILLPSTVVWFSEPIVEDFNLVSCFSKPNKGNRAQE